LRVTLFHMGFPEYVMGLANALSAHAQVTVVHPETVHSMCVALGDPAVRMIPFKKPAVRRDPRNLVAMGRGFQLIKDSRPDIVHVQEMFDYSYDLRCLSAKLPGLVTTIHDVKPHPGDGHAAPGLQYTKAIGCWRSRRLIVHTTAMRSQLSRRFLINEKRIDVIPHGELGSLYKRAARSAGVSVAPRDPFTILFFGRIWRYKGLQYLLEAFPQIKRTVPGARLLICGRGSDLDANRDTIARLPDVEVHDHFVPAHDVAGLFERASVVVLPYIEASQSGVSAIGFTTGAVVVASRVGGLAELIKDKESGVLVTPRSVSELADAITELLADRANQERIRRCAAALGSSVLSWDVIAEKTMETYSRVLGSPEILFRSADASSEQEKPLQP
jgi:glycosyltransferase involved in cell wall biosynthesis